ncbi:hypothetical protein TNCV_3944701 [Trichonephila clavipes]|nr:hypothetical protein TNCV_3944701 [Trichonephila clavipes]
MLPTIFGRTLIGQLPYSQKGGNAAVFPMSCEVVESDLKRMFGMESFLLGDELTRGYAAENSLSDFGKESPDKKYTRRNHIGIDFGSVSIHFPLRWALEGINGKGKKMGKDLTKRNKRVQLPSWDKTWKELVPVVLKLEFKVERVNNNMNGGNA